MLLNESMQVKISDFALCARVRNDRERRRSVVGSPNYIAPEILDDDRYGGHNKAVDIWSLGVSMFKMLFGVEPFHADTNKKIYSKIRLHDFEIPNNIKVSDNALNLLSKMLEPTPHYRIKIEDLMLHPFFKGPETLPFELSPSFIHTPPSKEYLV